MKRRVGRVLEALLMLWCATSVFWLACGFAQDAAPQNLRAADRTRPKAGHQDTPRNLAPAPPDSEKTRRLEFVLWNPNTHVIEWEVAEGSLDADEKFTADGELLIFRIHLDEALMEHKGQWRRIKTAEAAHVHDKLDWLTVYAIESTASWDAGEGEPVQSPKSTPNPSPRSQEKK